MSKFVEFPKLKKMMKVDDCNVTSFPLLKEVIGRRRYDLNNPETKRELFTITGSTAIEEMQQRNSRSSYGIIYICIVISYLAENRSS